MLAAATAAAPRFLFRGRGFGILGIDGGRFVFVRLRFFTSIPILSIHSFGEIGGADRGGGNPLLTLGALSPVDMFFGAVESGCRNDLDFDVELPFESREFLSAVVLQGVGQFRMEFDPDSTEAASDRAGFDTPQDVEANELGTGNRPRTTAGRTWAVGAKLQGLFQALTVDLQQPVVRQSAGVCPGLVVFHRVTHGLLDLALVLGCPHVDEVDHDQTTDVAQPELPCHLPRRLEIGGVGGLFLAAPTGCAAGVDVDGGQGLGSVDDDRSAAGQLDHALIDSVNLFLEVIAAE